MIKKDNVTNAEQVSVAVFRKLFGDAPEMARGADAVQCADFENRHPHPYYLFAVPRELPVCNFQEISPLLLDKTFEFTAQPGEFYVFQLVLWAPHQALGNVRISSKDAPLPWRCFNLPVGRRMNVGSHRVQPLWMGLEIPEDAQGRMDMSFLVETDNFPSQEVSVSLTVAGDCLTDGGVNDLERMARLKWLDSTIGEADKVFPPYVPMSRNGNEIRWLGHALELEENGLPRHITTFYQHGQITEEKTELLNAPFRFGSASEAFQGQVRFLEEKETQISWQASGQIGTVPVTLQGKAEFDGTVTYRIQLDPQADGSESFALSMQHRECSCFMGLNRHGGSCPERLDWYWDAQQWQDGYWIGSDHAGMAIRLFDSHYRIPLVNAYYNFSPLNLPTAWYNAGQGGISLHRENHGGMAATIFSGDLSLSPGVSWEFSFELQITPFHPVELERFTNEHFYHPHMHGMVVGGQDPLENADFAQLKREGVTCLNIHHAVGMNPIINYPFVPEVLARLGRFTQQAHEHGLKVIFYYTIRELTVHCPEFWCFWSMGNEIFYPGLGMESLPCTNPSGPHEWLCTMLKDNFLPAWAEVIKNGEMAGNIDLALETTPGSRLENFYLEGLNFLLDRIPLDGLYLDDSALSAQGFRRLWRIFHAHGVEHPIIDFHAWNPFSFKRERNFGSNSVLLRDLKKMPYVTDLWLGESVDYEAASPEYYLTELSGLPLGLSGEMLQNGGNPWRGLLFGMTSRWGWFGDPRGLWMALESFGTEGLRIECLMKAPAGMELGKGVRLSRFTNAAGKVAYAAASWCAVPSYVKADVAVVQPQIEGFQEKHSFGCGEEILLDPGKGAFLLPAAEQ